MAFERSVIDGDWFLPDNPDNQVRGTLHIDENEPSLRKRLKSLLNTKPALASKLIGDSNDSKEFISKTTQTRNVYTHYTKIPDKEYFSSPKELRWATGVLLRISVALILDEVGLGEEEIIGLVTRP